MSLGPAIELKYDGILNDRAAFWDEIYEEHYRGPVMPYTPTTTEPTTIESTSTSTESTSNEPTPTETTSTEPATTASTTTADPSGAITIIISNFMILVVSLPFFMLYVN